MNTIDGCVIYVEFVTAMCIERTDTLGGGSPVESRQGQGQVFPTTFTQRHPSIHPSSSPSLSLQSSLKPHYTYITRQCSDTTPPLTLPASTTPHHGALSNENIKRTRWPTLHSTFWAMLPSTAHSHETATTALLLTTALEPSSRKKMRFLLPFLSGEVFLLST